MTNIVGRHEEIQKLQRLLASDKAALVAIYGRRRVGKTYLVRQYFKDKGIYFEVTGIKDSPTSEQLRKFHSEFCQLFPVELSLPQPEDWHEALSRLKNAVSLLPKDRKVIIFFDELPWLAKPKSGLLQEIDYFWNRHFSSMSNVLFIVCGSAAAWMIKNIIRDKGGLHGRLTDQLYLQPFTLLEVETYLQDRKITLDRKQILQLYMVLGGVAKYLSYIRRGLSVTQMIDELCFKPQGTLLIEFTDLYRSLFGKAGLHMEIIKVLSAKRHGMLRNELLAAIKKKTSGKISVVLDELEESGFIHTYQKFAQITKEKRIRLSDEYSYFYLKFIAPLRSQLIYGGHEQHWQKIQSSPQWSSWSGYSFEMLCLKHIRQIKQSLGISGITTTQSQWVCRSQNKEDQGAEIDLIIDRADNCINLCEIKFCDSEYTITKEYAKILERKRQLFKDKTQTKKTLFITLITPYGIKQNAYSLGMVDNELTMDALFVS